MPREGRMRTACLLWMLAALAPVARPAGGLSQAPEPADPTATPPAVEKLDEDRVRVGAIVVDQKLRQMTLVGTVNPATVLEYLATSVDAFKSYESALDLKASVTEFNLALILLGLDPEHGVPSSQKFDPEIPQGDAVEIWIEWRQGDEARRMRAEQVLVHRQTEEPLPDGPWVYTGSVLLPDGQLLAAAQGVLIGFMHTPESVIDSPRDLEASYGAHRLIQGVGLDPGTPVEVIIRAAADRVAQ